MKSQQREGQGLGFTQEFILFETFFDPDPPIGSILTVKG